MIYLPSLQERLQQDPNELALLVSSLIARLTGTKAEAMAEQVVSALSLSVPAHYPWPGNVRELEQAVRRTILGRPYIGEPHSSQTSPQWLKQAAAGSLTANEVLTEYCKMLYLREGSYERVAALTQLDRRTVKKYVG